MNGQESTVSPSLALLLQGAADGCLAIWADKVLSQPPHLFSLPAVWAPEEQGAGHGILCYSGCPEGTLSLILNTSCVLMFIAWWHGCQPERYPRAQAALNILMFVNAGISTAASKRLSHILAF